MEVFHRDVAFEDYRGTITDVIQDASIGHVAIFTSKTGTVRGNHYHKESTAYIFVISGKLSVAFRFRFTPIQTVLVCEGDIIKLEPLERHALTALEDTTFLMLTSGPEGGKQYESDTVREMI